MNQLLFLDGCVRGAQPRTLALAGAEADGLADSF